MAYLWLLISSTCSVLASIALKSAGSYRTANESAAMASWTPYILYVAAISAYGAGFVMYALALRRLDLSIAYPIMVASSIAGVFGYGLVTGAESITLARLAGGALVAAGIFLITR